MEIRVADVCTEVDDALLIAALDRALVDTAAAEWHDRRPTPQVSASLLRAAAWRAARTGTDGKLVDAIAVAAVPAWVSIDRLVEYSVEALATNGGDGSVAAALDRIRVSGTAADWQRRAFGRRELFSDVIDDAARRTVA